MWHAAIFAAFSHMLRLILCVMNAILHKELLSEASLERGILSNVWYSGPHYVSAICCCPIFWWHLEHFSIEWNEIDFKVWKAKRLIRRHIKEGPTGEPISSTWCTCQGQSSFALAHLSLFWNWRCEFMWLLHDKILGEKMWMQRAGTSFNLLYFCNNIGVSNLVITAYISTTLCSPEGKLGFLLG